VARESKRALAERARRIARILFEAHPDARIALDFRNPFELICATVLSAQCTDERVNKVTPELFARFPDAASLAAAGAPEIERLIKSTGFFNSKTRSLLGLSKALVERHGGNVPRTMEALVELPGVGRKTANVVLGNAYDTPGVVVDTHVSRVSQRLELTEHEDPVEIEHDLMPLVAQSDWTHFSHAMIFHGRRICIARKPRCDVCPLYVECPYPKRRAKAAPATKQPAGPGSKASARAAAKKPRPKPYESSKKRPRR
jgi:endonuclease-3